MSDWQWTLTETIAAIAAAGTIVGALAALWSVSRRSNKSGNGNIIIDGSNNTVNTGSGSINIGMSEEVVERLLANIEQRHQMERTEWMEKYEAVVSDLQSLRSENADAANVEEAIAAFNDGDISRAIKLKEGQIQDNKEKHKGDLTILGDMYTLKFDYEKALDSYQKASKLGDEGELDIQIAQTLMKLGRYEEAEPILRARAENSKALLEIGIPTAYALSWKWYLDLLLVMEKRQEAEELLAQVEADLDGNSAISLLEDTKGKLGLFSNSRIEDALKRLEVEESRFGKFNYKVIGPLNDLAQSYDGEGLPEKASPIYERIIQIFKSQTEDVDPTDRGPICINYAFNQFSVGDFDRGYELILSAVEALGIEHPFFLNVLPGALSESMEAESWETAKSFAQLYVRALKLDPQENAKRIKELEEVMLRLRNM